MNTAIKTIILLVLDLASKKMATLFFPNLVVYNKDMVFNLASNDLIKFGAPLALIGFSLFTVSMLESKKSQQWAYALVLASFLGNYVGRFDSAGVVDFINLNYCVANLADIYGWISSVIVGIGLLKQFNQK